MFNSFLKLVCVYWGCNCLRPQQKLRIEELLQSHQGWIFNFFAVSSKRCWEWGRDSGDWGHCSIGHHLTFAATSPLWSATELSRIWEQWFVTDVKTGRGGEDEGKKVFGYGDCVCVGVEEILTYVTFVSSNREDFQTVIWWCTKMDWAATAVRILVDFSSHMGM